MVSRILVSVSSESSVSVSRANSVLASSVKETLLFEKAIEEANRAAKGDPKGDPVGDAKGDV